MGQGQSGFELTGHSKAVYACSCSEDGQLLLSGARPKILSQTPLPEAGHPPIA